MTLDILNSQGALAFATLIISHNSLESYINSRFLSIASKCICIIQKVWHLSTIQEMALVSIIPLSESDSGSHFKYNGKLISQTYEGNISCLYLLVLIAINFFNFSIVWYYFLLKILMKYFFVEKSGA